MARGVVLTAVERAEISHGIAAGRTGRVIARRLGRHYSVVNREVARNGGRAAYRSCQAHKAAAVRRGRPKDRKELESNNLCIWWSDGVVSVTTEVMTRDRGGFLLMHGELSLCGVEVGVELAADGQPSSRRGASDEADDGLIGL
jgi:hypothetical protein